MAQDLLAHYLARGMTREDVEALLGPPWSEQKPLDASWNDRRRVVRYVLGPAAEDHTEYLGIAFDAEGRVEKLGVSDW